MKTIIVKIFTEYDVEVLIGERKEFRKYCKKYLNNEKFFEEKNNRGCCIYRAETNECPLILIDGDFDAKSCIATLAHESVHALDYIENYIGLNDKSGEFHGHGIGHIVREVLKKINFK